MRVLNGLVMALGLAAPVAATAEGLFSAAITVNDVVITNYELDQRAKLLAAFGTPGDVAAAAREQMIDDALRSALFTTGGMRLTDEGMGKALDEFASRANLSFDEFAAQLAGEGVDRQSIEDYVRINVTWRDYVRMNYGSEVEISEADIDAAITRAGGTGSRIQVLLSEIIIPAPPERAAEALQIAEQIAGVTTTGAFEAAAREYSALPSKEQGGRLPWRDLTEYPAALHGLIMDLDQNAVTAPLPITNGVALFQMRGVREVPGTVTGPAQLDYATFTIPGGRSAEGLAEAARIDAVTDTCEDLYAVAKGLPEDRLSRVTGTPDQIEQDIALELARLDAGESSNVLTRNNGQTLLYVMLCNRIPQAAAEADREAVRETLRSRQLSGYADALLADLRATAVIVEQ